MFSYAPNAAIDLVFPAGSILVSARVRDSLGGETEILTDSLSVVYPSGEKGRRDLAPERRGLPGWAWLEAAAALVDDALRQGRADLVNRQVLSTP